MLGELFILLACLAAVAFFAGIETGVISIPRIRLLHHVEKNEPWAKTLDLFLEHPEQLFGTTLVGTNVAMVVASVLAAHLGWQLLGAWGEVILGAALTVAMLVFCEYLPKAWFQSHPMPHCRRFARPLEISRRALRPLVVLVNAVTRRLIPAAEAPAAASHAPFVTREELKVLAQEGEQHGTLSPRQRIMIHRAFELSGKRASQIMVPSERIVSVSATATVEEFLRAAAAADHSRLPVFDRGSGRYIGIVNAFEALAEQPANGSAPVIEYMRPPFFLRDATPVTEILPRLRRSRQPLCLVTAAAGEVVGLITSQNVVEEIVGKL